MNEQMMLIAKRISELRDLFDKSAEEMADITGVTPDEYRELENGGSDFSFTFLYKAARAFGVDITDLLTGEMPKLTGYDLTRAGEGLPIVRRAGFKYLHTSYLFKDKTAEPFVVTAKHDKALEQGPITMNRHDGQEYDFILEGSLRMCVDGHEFIMNAGDCVYYDSSKPHGMTAAGGADCKFIAIILKPDGDKSKGVK